MQKLMKNWIFTLIGCILLAMLSVLMFLDGLDVGGLHMVDRMLHLVAALALAVYVVLVLFPLIARYRGVLRGFAVGETLLLSLVALAHFCMEWFAVPLISSMEVCAVLGLVLWTRSAVEILHAYLSVGGDAEKRVPLWRLVAYILLCALGVWQMADPLITDKVFLFAIGAVAGVMALLFAVMTVSNRRASAPVRAARKEENAAQALPLADETPAMLAEKNEE